MPELPEVETIRRGLISQVVGATILGAAVREPRLRWPVSAGLGKTLAGARILALQRHGKYLAFLTDRGNLIVHLGMSGSLRLVQAETAPLAHEHLDILLDHPWRLRFRDPRRFGAVLWWVGPVESHPLLADLGPEPLTKAFSGETLFRATRGRAASIKAVLMDSRRVAGIGNIYANEALFAAGIRPFARAGSLSRPRCDRLCSAVKAILRRAIRAGGSSLRDFVDVQGEPGQFQLRYTVYGRGGEPCRVCGNRIREIRQLGRASWFCPACQR